MSMPNWAMQLPWKVITAKARKYNLDPCLMAAMIQVESAGARGATRYEAGWRYHTNVAKWAKLTRVTHETERRGQMVSWGLMQVMGTVARELGYDGCLPLLCEEELGIEYGCMKFRQVLNRWDGEREAISAYNAGHPTDNNQGYVSKVTKFRLELKSE